MRQAEDAERLAKREGERGEQVHLEAAGVEHAHAQRMHRRDLRIERRRPASVAKDEDDLEFEEDVMSDEEYFVAELRGAVARAMSSSLGGRDLHDGPWGGGFDRLQIDLAE